MKGPKRIVFTRHPECLHNVSNDDALRKGIANRQSPLTPLGMLQRDITAEYLLMAFGAFDAVFTSTYERTKTIPVAAGFGKSAIATASIDERNMGVWHLYPRSTVLELHPGEEQRLKAVGYYAYEAPGGETCMNVEDRIRQLMASDCMRQSLDTVYLSAHGISGLCLRRVLTGATLEDWHAWDRLKNGAVCVYERDVDAYTCTLYNYIPWEGKIDPKLLDHESREA